MRHLHPTGGGTELPPRVRASADGQYVRDATFVRGGVAYVHATYEEDDTVDLFLYFFGAVTPELVGEFRRVGALVGIPSPE